MLGDYVYSEIIASDMQKAANNLYKLVTSSGRSYQSIADGCGISKGSLSLYTRGLGVPRADTIYRLITELNCTEDDLFEGLEIYGPAIKGNFYENINFLFNLNGGSLRRVSAEIGISHTELRKYLKGKAIPRLDSLFIMSKYFGVSIRSLSGKW